MLRSTAWIQRHWIQIITLAIVWLVFAQFIIQFNNELDSIEPKKEIPVNFQKIVDDSGFFFWSTFKPVGKGLYVNEPIQCNFTIGAGIHDQQPLPENTHMAITFENAALSENLTGNYSSSNSLYFNMPSDGGPLYEHIFLKYLLSGNNPIRVNLYTLRNSSIDIDETYPGIPIEPSSIRIQIESSRIQLYITSLSVVIAATAVIASLRRRDS